LTLFTQAVFFLYHSIVAASPSSNLTSGAQPSSLFIEDLTWPEVRDAIANGRGSLVEGERQLGQLKVFAGMSAVTGGGITVRIEGTFDERALSDLVNELRNAGAEAIAVNSVRVGPRSWFGATPERVLTVDSTAVRGPWQVRAVGSTEVMYIAMTRTGGIIGQFELIYKGTRFSVSRDAALQGGASAYMTKPFTPAALAASVVRSPSRLPPVTIRRDATPSW